VDKLIDLESIDPVRAIFKRHDYMFYKAQDRLYEAKRRSDRSSIAEMSSIAQYFIMDVIKTLEQRGEIRSGRVTAKYDKEKDQFELYLTVDIGFMKGPKDLEMLLTEQNVYFVERNV